MAYRFTNTDKWNDVWFRNLKPAEKLLFTYMCDNCDVAGFIELDIDKWAFDTGYAKNIIEGALKGLGRGLKIADTGDCIYICNFLKHQKNLPLNERNNAHQGILKRFELYAYKFSINPDIDSITIFIEGATKGLKSPIGSGKGSGKGKKDNYLDFVFDENYKGVLQEWFKYKQSRGETYKTKQGREKFYASLYRLSSGTPLKAQEIIDQSMSNNWAGIFELKGKQVNNKSAFV